VTSDRQGRINDQSALRDKGGVIPILRYPERSGADSVSEGLEQKRLLLRASRE
jgi:hypothetical protein